MGFSDDLRAAYAEQPFLLAPMAGVTDAAYRIMCRRRGAAMAYSEMVSVAGLAYASNKTWRLVLPEDEEPQICVQLFGSKPEQFAGAVDAVQERVGDKLLLIDINMACPARKVITKGEGSALMETPELAADIVRAAVERAQVPVTVKMRIAFRTGERTAPELARMLEDAGAAAVAVHGRTAKQLYTGAADWSIIDEVADAVEIPVVGSGDVFSAEDAVRMLKTTKAEAVFVARGTYGNPWIFDDARALAADGTAVPVRSAHERLEALREHLGLVHRYLPFMARARTFATWYLKGMPHAAAWRGRVVKCTDYRDFMDLVDEIEADVAVCEEILAAGGTLPPLASA
ncbi:tRNA dihydrouridine synthase DusB [Collinsella sp. An271]|uniref:tRNA dihydrouridine synthase DusB n=1 Tax=Collinsella sp. An271 TaxID=1965616 RepID=UPI000B36673E|nr:tRNA dihydrouridine synthase DusB [Collinsella sp. An271]OUO62314.1 tRNA dihydrouridine synthase DusB [Collinsella sp. An271]